MPFNRPSLKDIYQRVSADMQSRINNAQTQRDLGIFQVKLLKSSLLGVLVAVFAGISHSLYGYLAYIIKQILPDTAEDDWLIRHAALYGITLLSAVKAVGSVTFFGVPGTVVPLGTAIQNDDGTRYLTTQAITIGGGGSYLNAPIEAETPGVVGNMASGAFTLVSPIPNIDSAVPMYFPCTGGSDTETIEGLRSRLLLQLRKPITGGTVSDYVSWALEVEGVANAWCFPAVLGPGTVGIPIAGANNSTVNSTVIDACLAHILTKCPIGSNPYVESIIPTTFSFNISVPAATSADVKSQMASNIQQLFLDEAQPGGTIYESHLNSALITSGVVNYTVTAMFKNGAPYTVGDIITTGYDLAVAGTVTITGV